MVCNHKGPNKIHVIFDKIVTPSIKGCERDLKMSDNDTNYQIKGPQQLRLSNWSNVLSNTNFK